LYANLGAGEAVCSAGVSEARKAYSTAGSGGLFGGARHARRAFNFCGALARPRQAAAGIDTSESVMPDFSAVLQRPPHPLVSRLEAAVSGLLSTVSEVAALHGEMARIAASRCSAAAASGDQTSEELEVAGVVGSRDSVLSDGFNAVFGGLTML
jgi:hypothetical protein